MSRELKSYTNFLVIPNDQQDSYNYNKIPILDFKVIYPLLN